MKNRPELLSQPLSGNEIVFHTLFGPLTVDISGEEFLLHFPGDSFEASNLDDIPFENLSKAIGCDASQINIYARSKSYKYAVVTVDPKVDIASLKVDSAALVYFSFLASLLTLRVNCFQVIWHKL